MSAGAWLRSDACNTHALPDRGIRFSLNIFAATCLTLMSPLTVADSHPASSPDLQTISRIRDEGLEHSHYRGELSGLDYSLWPATAHQSDTWVAAGAR